MPSIYQLKSTFQGLLRPSVRKLAARGVTANQVTLAAIVLSGFGGALIASFPTHRWPLLLLPLILFLRMALNAMDGMLAREHFMQSPLGDYLNELGDVVSDSMLYLPFALIPGISAWLVVLVGVLAIVSEMAGIMGVKIGATRRYDGPMGKSDRAFVFGAIALLLGLGLFSAGMWVDVVLGAVAILLALTIGNRVRAALLE